MQTMASRSSTSDRRSAMYEDLSNVEFETSEEVEVVDKFKNMGLREELMRGIFAYGMFSVRFSLKSNNGTIY